MGMGDNRLCIFFVYLSVKEARRYLAENLSIGAQWHRGACLACEAVMSKGMTGE
jgi:hypothetical protein